MKKSAIVVFFAAFLSLSAVAQSVQEGLSHLYAQRYQSAKAVFDKLIAANPNNIEANYWLGQVYLAQKNVSAARSLYEKAAAASQNAPLITVGLGHVELLEHKPAEARAHFEGAINASRGKKGNDANILAAVGRANVNAYSEKDKAGDLNYAVTKLQEAAGLAANNPEVFITLGNAYRKLGNKGSEAVQAYRQAASASPAYSAVSSYRQGMLYRTQINYNSDPSQWTVVLENLNSAITADAKFTPALEELYYYNLFSKQDFNTAQNLAQQIRSNSDASPDLIYLEVQPAILQKDWAKAISLSKSILSQTQTPNPRVYRALAVSSMNLKDTNSACDYIGQFFTKATDEDLLASDYIIQAQSCGRGKPEVVLAAIQEAIRVDSGNINKQRLTIANWLKEDKENKAFQASLRLLDYQLRANNNLPTNSTELISLIAVPMIQGGLYPKADSVLNVYNKLAPDSAYGYYWQGRMYSTIDSTMEQGLAVPHYDKALEVAEKNPARFASLGIAGARYNAVYNANVKKDYATARAYIARGLKLDPANADLLSIQKVLENAGKQPARPATPATPATNGNKTTGNKPASKPAGSSK